jgi:hypothetical protein
MFFGLFYENRQMIFGIVAFFVKRVFFEVFFRKIFEKYEISHQTVVFVETTTQIPKSGDKHQKFYSQKDCLKFVAFQQKSLKM